ncbi:hypothetical protein WJX77_011914 [Trebouxia sp. C0004]
MDVITKVFYFRGALHGAATLCPSVLATDSADALHTTHDAGRNAVLALGFARDVGSASSQPDSLALVPGGNTAQRLNTLFGAFHLLSP